MEIVKFYYLQLFSYRNQRHCPLASFIDIPLAAPICSDKVMFICNQEEIKALLHELQDMQIT